MAGHEDGPGTDVVRLVGLGGIGRHGVYPEERRDGQTFLVDLAIHLDTTEAATTDDVGATVDYGAVASEVLEIVSGEPVHLIETLAARIADTVLARDRVLAVDVTVHKPEAPLGVPFTDVQVQIHRSRAAPGAGVPAGQEAAGAQPQAGARGTAEGVPVPSPAQPLDHGVGVLDRDPGGPVAVVLGLGGNVGDVRSTLRAALDDLSQAPGLSVDAVSPLARTAAVIDADAVAQPDYLNAVALCTTTLSPRALLELTRSVEDSYGRERTERWGQRTLDIDIIDYDGVTSTEEWLTIPHPRASDRAFVLVPWAQVDPDAFLPGPGGGPVATLAETAPDRDGVRWLALDWLDRNTHGTDSGSFVIAPQGESGAREAGEAPAPREAPPAAPPTGAEEDGPAAQVVQPEAPQDPTRRWAPGPRQDEGA